MYIRRDMEKVIVKLTGEYPAILVTGPRQVGKTTMLKSLMQGSDRSYVTLDDLNARMLARNDPAMFFQLYRPPVLIDEVQYAPELFTAMKIMIDRDHRPGDFWLTGSQVFKLMDGVRESLAGRIALLPLSSLSQNEIFNHFDRCSFSVDLEALTQKQKTARPADTASIFKRIFMGGMPAIASGAYTDLHIFYSSYLSTYLERDIKHLSGAIDSLTFLKFITATAARTAQLVNYAEIARDCDISQITAKKWIQVLEILGIIFLLQPWSNNVLNRAIKTPKLYFQDTGLVSWLTKWTSSNTLEAGAMNGAIYENYVISELVKGWQNSALRPDMYFYRDRDMKEIDIVLEKDGKLWPLEIKKSVSPKRNTIDSFRLLDKSRMPRGTGAVLCNADELSAFDGQNLIIPVRLI
jgi:uncharacterized protein